MSALIAAVAPLRPPASWFANPGLTAPTAIEVTEDGRVYGHAALFDSCHTADPHGVGVCVTPPRSRSDYRYFHLGEISADGGERIAVGQITLDAPHAPLRADRRQAARHYDHTGYAVADVRCGEDQFGIWVAGALRPGVPDERKRELAAAKLSGDWRNVRGSLELIGLLAVNVPGFLVPRTRVAAGLPIEDEDERLALVAAGVVDERAIEHDRQRRMLFARAHGISGLARRARGE